MARYQREPFGGVERLEDRAWISNDENNRDWRDYQAWLRAGNSPLPLPSFGGGPTTDPTPQPVAQPAQRGALFNVKSILAMIEGPMPEKRED
jgi:hypothetical protein